MIKPIIMKQNIGRIDRIIRMILGIAIAMAGYYYKTWWGLLAVIPFVTSFTGNCPLYSLFEVNTCDKEG
jgi:Protein of unknown function (DUF2892)